MSRAAFFLACSTFVMSCIPTREPGYEPPPNYPPSVRGSQAWPTDRVHIVSVDEGTGSADGGVGGAMELTISAIVRDPNVDQDLEGWVFVNRDPNDPETGTAQQIDIEATGEFEREESLPSIPFGRLVTGDCNRVELQVSRQFSNTFPNLEPGTAIDGTPDLGVAVWFIGLKQDPDDPAPDMTGCQSQ